MKKGLALIGLVVAVLAVYLLFFSKKEVQSEAPKDQPLAQSKNSEAFNQSLNQLLSSYYLLKNALVEWDTAKATTQAIVLSSLANQFPISEFKADSTLVLTAISFLENISAESKGIANDSSIDEKRKSFYTLSENLYSLLNTVRYDQQVIFHVKCPMALGEDKSAYWISNSAEIVNPYLGKKHPIYHSAMINCGSVEDSIDWRGK